MKYFLVKESGNYADEFDIQGFKIFEAESEEKVKEQIISDRFDDDIPEYPLELYFGTNEAVEINSEQELWSMLDITEISKQDYDVLLRLFPSVNKNSFGLTGIL